MKTKVPRPDKVEAKAILDLDLHLKIVERHAKHVIDHPQFSAQASRQENDLAEVVIEHVCTYRRHFAARHWHAAALWAYKIGMVSCQMLNAPVFQISHGAMKAAMARNEGLNANIQKRHDRWIREARTIHEREPELSQKAIAERIAKQEKRMRLKDACGWRAVNDVIRQIFEK